jgi:ribosomal protein L35
MKTNKSYAKRLKMSRNGKITSRKPGKNHFNAKESRSTQLAGKRSQIIVMKPKDVSRYLANSK